MRKLIFVLLFSPLAFADITYIGDSQSSSRGGLFSQLRKTLEAYAPVSSARGICGAKIDDFLSHTGVESRCDYEGITFLDSPSGKPEFVEGRGHSEFILDLMKKTDIAVIELGDNHLSDAKQAGALAAEIAQQILSAGKSCIWIGPASVPETQCADNRRRKKEVSEAIKASLDATVIDGKMCIFIDSWMATDLQPPRSGDCLHYVDYREWAEPIRDLLNEALDMSTGV